MDGAKPNKTPMKVCISLSKNDQSSLVDARDYRSLVGALQYLTLTRPDICFSVNKLAQFMQSPKETHLTALKRILRYLKNTLSHGLLLRKSSLQTLVAFCDSDHGGDEDDKRSTSAYVLFLGKNPISWKSTKQRSVSRSTTESEYKSIANACAETAWVRNLLHELHMPLSQSPTIYCDNLGANYLSHNPVFHSRMKHLALDFHFVREQVANGNLHVHHISSHDQIADALTKPLPFNRYSMLRTKLGVQDLNTSLRGRINEHIPGIS